MARFALALVALLGLASAAQAQGTARGAQEGAARGEAIAGPLGAAVGGAVGAAVGTANSLLGIDRRERFRLYAMGERRPSFALAGPVRVGTVLPEGGVGVLRRAAGIRPQGHQLHDRQRPSGAGRARHPPHPGGDRLTANPGLPLPGDPDEPPPGALPPGLPETPPPDDAPPAPAPQRDPGIDEPPEPDVPAPPVGPGAL